MRKKLICIVGGSGVGKNELAKTINATYGIKSIVSYTTRPKREGEVNHVDYHFVDKCPSDHSSFLEYNNFNGFDYWSTLEDLNDDAYTFIVEENGLRALRNNAISKVRLYTIEVDRPYDLRIKSGVSNDRIDRDKNRISLMNNERNAYFKNIYTNKKQMSHAFQICHGKDINKFLKKSVYISVPMTGHLIDDIQAEIDEAKILYPNCNIYSPLEILPVNKYLKYSDYLGKDIQVLLDDIDEAFFCDGWQKSRGCMLEYYLCDIYNIKITDSSILNMDD